VPRQRSGPLAAWTAAWLAGRAASDEVLRAVRGDDAPHQISGLGDFDDEPMRLSEVLITWRKADAEVRLVLPVAGDVRGLPGPAEFRSAALEAGEAVCGGSAEGGIGIVPQITDYAPSSAPTTVLWQAFEIGPLPHDYQSVADAQHDLTTAIRESAVALAAADVAGWAHDIADALGDARRAGERLNLPPGHPSRAVALLSQAERLQAVLELAAEDPIGGAIDRMGIAARNEALRPLAIAVRRARLAGYNAASAEAHEPA
jgi:hypothetical protein